MAVKSPKQAVYYYEAGNGRFRLVYFIPPEELLQLSQAGRISDEALTDYPDGVDLGCTKPDFDEFEALYNYRPANDPEALQRAFFTIFSATRNWRKFRGSGLIPADVLENAMAPVEASLRQADLTPEEIQPLPKQAPLAARRRTLRRRDKRQKRLTRHLERMTIEGIDPGRSLRRQRFPEIQMQEGKSAEELFTELHRKQKRRPQ
jgi:hypothetical protein